MLKFLIIGEHADEQMLRTKLQSIIDIEMLQTATPADLSSKPAIIDKADFVISERKIFAELFALAQQKSAQRQQIKAVTHQGIRLVPVDQIYYFQAEHKYVTVVHAGGSLLIEDSLNALEQEFADLFIRIHRKTLVAKQQIAALQKNEQGNFVLSLRNTDELFMVSRRQVSSVRKALLCL